MGRDNFASCLATVLAAWIGNGLRIITAARCPKCVGAARLAATSGIVFMFTSIALSVVGRNDALGAPADLSNETTSPIINVSDVGRFYKIYEASGGRPTVDNLQQQYLEVGTPGLKAFAKSHSINGATIAAAMEKNPKLYADAKSCADVLSKVNTRLTAVTQNFAQLYPEALSLPITIAVGPGNPVGIADATNGVIVNVESLCAVKTFDADIEDRLVHVTAHEYVHAQQKSSLLENANPTVLQRALAEGAAEFIGEMVSGGLANPALQNDLNHGDSKIEMGFAFEDDSTDLSHWIFDGSFEQPGDGYRIVKGYYLHTIDKHAAVREIMRIDDADAFLVKSGWRQGKDLR